MITKPALRHLPWVVFALALTVGFGMAAAVFRAEKATQRSEIARSADRAVDRIGARLNEHLAILSATKGLFVAEGGEVDRARLADFVRTLDLEDRYGGIQGLGFARLVPADQAAQAAADAARSYGTPVTLRPPVGEAMRTPITLLEPMNARNAHALGYDMNSEPVRRAAMAAAARSGQMQASGPVELVQEITADKQMGFLVYLPLYARGAVPAGARSSTVGPAAGPLLGFVYAPFRAGDLIRAALSEGPPLPVDVAVMDVAAPESPLYTASKVQAGPEGEAVTRDLNAAGRDWRIRVWPAAGAQLGPTHLGAALMGVLSALFATVAGLAMQAKQAEARSAKAMAANMARVAENRQTLLHEMRHRIKNAITRIQAIARQSARGATDVEAFTSVFLARLQAMAAAQDILVGAGTAEAPLRALLARELGQSFSAEEVETILKGPDLQLGERQAHALSLVAHELLTNALKYGAIGEAPERLSVRWALGGPAGAEDRSTPRWVWLTWSEAVPPGAPAPTPGKAGFGTRLIEMSVTADMGGRVERAFEPDAMRVRIGFPLA